MATEINPAEPPRDIYANAAKESDKLMQRGRLFCKDVKVFVSNQYNLLKRHDKAFFPAALVAASVCMLFTGNILMLIASFASGALFRVALGDTWKEGIVRIAKEAWQGSNLGKIGCAAFLILFAAPMRWNLAAFGLGIYVVHLLENRPATAPATAPAAQPQQAAVPQGPQLPVPPPAVPHPAAVGGVAVGPAVAPPQQAAAPKQRRGGRPAPRHPIAPPAAPPPQAQQPAAPAIPPAVLEQLGGLLQALQPPGNV